MIERVCMYCGKKFLARGNNAKCCGSDECRRADRERRKKYMRKWMRRKRAVQSKPSRQPRTCEICGAPVGGMLRFCADCHAKRRKEQIERNTATPRIKGGDGSGKWRARANSRAKLRMADGVHLRDADVVAGASAPYMDPECTRVEWRR